MRRSAAISQFAMGAAAEALGGSTGGLLGIVYCTTCGCVNYSRRFYDEVLRDPTVASPLLFPETVFNAPASHLSAVLGTAAANYTLVGDTGVFLHGLALAAGWLEAGRVERCLVVAAEEVDWIIADALRHFRKSATLTEGAGAVLLTRERTADTFAELECVTDPEPFTTGDRRSQRAEALRRVASALPDAAQCTFSLPQRRGEGGRRPDEGWGHPSQLPQPLTPALSPHPMKGEGEEARRDSGAIPSACIPQWEQLGEAFSAGTVWQVLAAIDAARQGQLPRATVCVPGAYQEAIGASFKIHPAATP
jgi:hypothetical protein